MAFQDNLYNLRKRDKITQEELADRLGVSRQSVSKWETGEAYPETDKLITLSDMFGVTLDELLRGSVEDKVQPTEFEPKAEERSGATAPQIDKSTFVAHMNAFSVKIALGVLLVLVGVAVCVALAGYSETLNGDFVGIMGFVALLIFVAVAVFLFVIAGIRHNKFVSEYPEIGEIFSKDERDKFIKRFATAMACLISAIIIDVVFLVVMSSLLDEGVIKSDNSDAAMCYVVSAFLFLLGMIVGLLVYFGLQHLKYTPSEYNKNASDSLNPSPKSKIKDACCSVIMLGATAIFLMCGFIWNLWHPAWVAFPVGGILCGMVGAIFDARKK